jgi:hypothetical protein
MSNFYRKHSPADAGFGQGRTARGIKGEFGEARFDAEYKKLRPERITLTRSLIGFVAAA